MCGKASTGTADLLPDWITLCAAKGTSDSYKLTIIRKHIMANYYYEDAEVPLTALLLKMAVKRAWLGKDGNFKRPSLINATEGLSPFLVLDLDEDEVAIINDEDDLIQNASLVSVSDLRGMKKKLKVEVPESSDDFMLLLRRYANLLYALFSEDCPFFKCLQQLIRALRDYSREARRKMSTHTKASILWIILLQARQFGMGEVNILHEFKSLHQDLLSKRSEITHSEVPLELVNKKSKRDLKDNDKDADDMDQVKKKKPRPPNANNWNPKLRTVLEAPLRQAKFPSFTKILSYCKCDMYSVFERGSKICAPNAVLGRCFHGDKCTKTHTMATEAQVPKILALLKPFIESPGQLKEG